MVKKSTQKRGTKAKYIAYGGRSVSAIVNGKLTGLCQASNGLFYYMYDDEKGKRRKKTCTSDIKIAYNRFMIFVEGKREEEFIHIKNPKHRRQLKKHFKDKVITLKGKKLNPNIDPVYYNGISVTDMLFDRKTEISEKEFFEWLLSYKGKEEELKRKSGISIKFSEKTDRATHIKLSTIFSYFKNNITFETQKSKDDYTTWIEHFFEFAGVVYINDITEDIVRRYEEEYLDPERIANDFKYRWKNNRAGSIKKALSFYAEKHPTKSAKVREVRQYLMIWDRTKDVKALDPDEITIEDFKKLYQSANLKWKAILLMSLNTMSGSTTLTEMKLEHVNFDRKYLKMIRKKKNTLKVGYLWTETIETIQAYLKQRKYSGKYLFPSNNKGKYNPQSIRNYIKRFSRTVKNKSLHTITFGLLRAAASTAADDGSNEIHYIEYGLGHDVTQAGKSFANYVARRPERMKPVADAIYKEFKIDKL